MIGIQNLKEQTFTIDTHKDTTVTTLQGITITIPADAIVAENAGVTLVVREALSLYDIMKAGLTTMSDGRMLSSNGMFSLNTQQNATITKSLTVKVPALYADTAMQLFRGGTKDGRINWTDPQPINVNKTPELTRSETLFKGNCASCHGIERMLTGPALAWVDKRWKNKRLLYDFIRNNQEVLNSGKSNYATCLFCRYNKTPMNLFTGLTDDDIEGLLQYINSEAKRLKVPENIGANGCDSCDASAGLYYSLLHKRDSLIKANGRNITVTRDTSSMPIDSLPLDIAESPEIQDTDTTGSEMVSAPVKKAEYYQVQINAFGWYNIDMFLKTADTAPSRLSIKLTGKFKNIQNVYLVIPSLQLFTEGGLLKDKSGYGFYTADGNIPLPQGEQAFIISLGEENGRLLMGEQHFTTTTLQTISVEVKETNKRKIRKAFRFIQEGGGSVEVKNSVNVKGIKKLDQAIGKLKEKLGECACQDLVSPAVEGEDYQLMPDTSGYRTQEP